MDEEINHFISIIPKNGVILDIGGCWGWHWRKIHKIRPDLNVVIVDLIRENLVHAKKILKENITNNKIFLVHANANSLKFDDMVFDAVWSVQTIQHIPDYKSVFREVYRVLKHKGHFWDYNLNNATLVRLIYLLFKKNYHLNGTIPNSFFLRRINEQVLVDLRNIFNKNFMVRYTEIIFTPDLGLALGGKPNSSIGWLDAKMGGSASFKKLFARQCSTHIEK